MTDGTKTKGALGVSISGKRITIRRGKLYIEPKKPALRTGPIIPPLAMDIPFTARDVELLTRFPVTERPEFLEVQRLDGGVDYVPTRYAPPADVEDCLIGQWEWLRQYSERYVHVYSYNEHLWVSPRLRGRLVECIPDDYLRAVRIHVRFVPVTFACTQSGMYRWCISQETIPPESPNFEGNPVQMVSTDTLNIDAVLNMTVTREMYDRYLRVR